MSSTHTHIAMPTGRVCHYGEVVPCEHGSVALDGIEYMVTALMAVATDYTWMAPFESAFIKEHWLPLTPAMLERAHQPFRGTKRHHK